MKIHVDIETEIEVSAKQVIEAINSLPGPDGYSALLNGINCFANFMSEVKDNQITAISESRRKIIGEFLESQSKRYLSQGQ